MSTRTCSERGRLGFALFVVLSILALTLPTAGYGCRQPRTTLTLDDACRLRLA